MSNKMKKAFNIRGMLDGLRQSVGSSSPKSETEIEETLRSEDLQVCKTVRHGFPYQPTALAYDSVQHLLAVGTKTGSLRIFGQPGVDLHCHHGVEVAVIQILFLVNEGALVTSCADDNLHLWNFRQKRPEIVHSLKFQRERITHCQLSFQSKWLYVGTERGNVHIVNIESFILSGYIINWNKAIELSRKTHPGPVIHLSDNPLDPNKLLIGFESGAVVLWDLRNKIAECRFESPEALRSISWNHEGKQFMGSHTDGSLTTWNIKASKPASIITPHAKIGKEGKPDPCKPITKVEWKSVRNSDPLVIFSGGMSYDRAGRTPCITVMTGKTTTVLEMEHNVVDFVVLCETPWINDYQDPYAIVVLLQNDLVVIDLTSPGYPCFENPYPMDIHESPVTACQYFADCPTDLIPALYSVGSKQKRTRFSEKRWPIKGGMWGTATCSYPEIIVTGHADGSLKFWDASAVTLQVLYKVKTAKIFEKPKNKTLEGQEDDPFAIYMMFLDKESRLLVLAGATHVMLFKFSKQESTTEVPSLDVSIIYEVCDDLDSPELDYPKPSLAVVGQHQSGSIGSHSSNTSDTNKPSKPSLGLVAQQQKSAGSYGSYSSDSTKPEQTTALKVRQGARKWGPGYQPDLVCLLTWTDNEHPGNITSVSINSSYGLLAFGNESGLAIVDIIQKSCLLNLGTPDLYGSMDPYQRAPRSPRGKKAQQPFDGSNPTIYTNVNDDGARSPTSDQSASPDNNPPQKPPRRKHRNSQGLILQMDSNKSNNQKGGPLTAPARESQFQFASPKIKSGHRLINEELTKNPEFAVTPATPQSGRKLKDENEGPVQGDMKEEVNEKDVIEVPRKMSVNRTSSLPLVTVPAVDVPMKVKSRSEDNFANTQTDSNILPDKVEKENEDSESKSSYPTTPVHVKKTIIQGFKKKMKKQKEKKRDKSKERALSSTYDTNGNAVSSTDMDNVFQEEITSKSETDDNTQSEDDLMSPNEEKYIQTKNKDGFFRRMSVKMKNLVFNEEDDFDERKPKKKDVSITVNDLTDEAITKKPSFLKMSLKELLGTNVMYLKPEPSASDKNDGSSFSRSRSSSMSSLENVSKEAIQCLVFADSYTRKFDNFTCPCLWVGTSLGSVLVIVMNLPPSGEQRLTQPVIVSPSGTIFRLKGAIQCMSFLDCNGMIIPAITSGAWKEDKNSQQKSQSTPLKIKISPSSSTEFADKQFAIICSEKQARVVSLPSQTCPYKVRISESSFVIKADVVKLRGESVCLACYVANGHIMVYSLPSLKLLLDVEFMALTDLRVARTFCFSNHGHAMYMCSPTELQKITYSAEICDNLNEMLGELFLPTETPEAPKQGFFKNLFGGSSVLDREELFGEASGTSSKRLATRVPGTGGMQQLQGQAAAATGVGGEVYRTRQLLSERGEKLSGISDRTEEMASQAEAFAGTAHQIMLKYKDKKWYQF